MGAPVRITAEAGVPHQDLGSVSIVSTATLQWCADRWGGSPDPRRLRVNIVVDSDEPFVEERGRTPFPYATKDPEPAATGQPLDGVC